jgi:hypothetical protein
MAANVTDKLWDMMDVVRMIEAYVNDGVINPDRECGGEAGYAARPITTNADAPGSEPGQLISGTLGSSLA